MSLEGGIKLSLNSLRCRISPNRSGNIVWFFIYHNEFSLRCNTFAAENLFDYFGLMNRKIKLVSIFFGTYLGVLPLFFYLHASCHEHESHKVTHEEIKLLCNEFDEGLCHLCKVYVKQDIFNKSISTFSILREFPIEKGIHSIVEVITSRKYHFLRAPPVYVKVF